MKWQDVVNAIVGAWLMVSAFLKFGASANLWNYLISGGIVLILSIWVGMARK